MLLTLSAECAVMILGTDSSLKWGETLWWVAQFFNFRRVTHSLIRSSLFCSPFSHYSRQSTEAIIPPIHGTMSDTVWAFFPSKSRRIAWRSNQLIDGVIRGLLLGDRRLGVHRERRTRHGRSGRGARRRWWPAATATTPGSAQLGASSVPRSAKSTFDERFLKWVL